MLEQYALHMCNVVKPTALDCFAQEISACSNAENLYKMADASGGTCLQVGGGTALNVGGGLWLMWVVGYG